MPDLFLGMFRAVFSSFVSRLCIIKYGITTEYLRYSEATGKFVNTPVPTSSVSTILYKFLNRNLITYKNILTDQQAIDTEKEYNMLYEISNISSLDSYRYPVYLSKKILETDLDNYFINFYAVNADPWRSNVYLGPGTYGPLNESQNQILNAKTYIRFDHIRIYLNREIIDMTAITDNIISRINLINYTEYIYANEMPLSQDQIDNGHTEDYSQALTEFISNASCTAGLIELKRYTDAGNGPTSMTPAYGVFLFTISIVDNIFSMTHAYSQANSTRLHSDILATRYVNNDILHTTNRVDSQNKSSDDTYIPALHPQTCNGTKYIDGKLDGNITWGSSGVGSLTTTWAEKGEGIYAWDYNKDNLVTYNENVNLDHYYYNQSGSMSGLRTDDNTSYSDNTYYKLSVWARSGTANDNISRKSYREITDQNGVHVYYSVLLDYAYNDDQVMTGSRRHEEWITDPGGQIESTNSILFVIEHTVTETITVKRCIPLWEDLRHNFAVIVEHELSINTTIAYDEVNEGYVDSTTSINVSKKIINSLVLVKNGVRIVLDSFITNDFLKTTIDDTTEVATDYIAFLDVRDGVSDGFTPTIKSDPKGVNIRMIYDFTGVTPNETITPKDPFVCGVPDDFTASKENRLLTQDKTAVFSNDLPYEQNSLFLMWDQAVAVMFTGDSLVFDGMYLSDFLPASNNGITQTTYKSSHSAEDGIGSVTQPYYALKSVSIEDSNNHLLYLTRNEYTEKLTDGTENIYAAEDKILFNDNYLSESDALSLYNIPSFADSSGTFLL